MITIVDNSATYKYMQPNRFLVFKGDIEAGFIFYSSTQHKWGYVNMYIPLDELDAEEQQEINDFIGTLE